MSTSNLLLVRRGSLLALVSLLSSSVGVSSRTRLCTGGETAGAHVFASFGLHGLLVGVEEGEELGCIYLARLDPGGVSLGHLASLAGHVDGLRGGLIGWELISCGRGGLDVEVAGGLVCCEKMWVESSQIYSCLVLSSSSSLGGTSM
jgi:hypothetical protein